MLIYMLNTAYDYFSEDAIQVNDNSRNEGAVVNDMIASQR